MISVLIGQVYSIYIYTLLLDFTLPQLESSPNGGASPTKDPTMHSDVQALSREVEKAPMWIHAHVAHLGRQRTH